MIERAKGPNPHIRMLPEDQWQEVKGQGNFQPPTYKGWMITTAEKVKLET